MTKGNRQEKKGKYYMWHEQLKSETSREDFIQNLLKKVCGKNIYLFGAGIGG